MPRIQHTEGGVKRARPNKPYKHFDNDEEKALAFVRAKLEEAPNTSKHYFYIHWDLHRPTLDRWEQEGKVQFADIPSRRKGAIGRWSKQIHNRIQSAREKKQ